MICSKYFILKIIILASVSDNENISYALSLEQWMC